MLARNNIRSAILNLRQVNAPLSIDRRAIGVTCAILEALDEELSEADALRAELAAAREVVEAAEDAESFIRVSYEAGQSVSPSLFLGVANVLRAALAAYDAARNSTADQSASTNEEG